jgi:hypothetical protein
MPASSDISATDAVNELRIMSEVLKSREFSVNEMTWKVLSRYISRELSSEPLFRAYAIANRRIDEVCKTIEEIEDISFTRDLRNKGIDSVRKVQNIFSIEAAAQPWSRILQTSVTNEVLTTLKFVSIPVRRHRPLSLVHEAQRLKLLVHIEEAHLQIVESAELPDWAIYALKSGIEDLKFRVSNYLIFGHDEVIDSLIKLQTSTVTITARLGINKKRLETMKTIVIALLLAKDVFIAPTDVYSSIAIWNSWVAEISKPLKLFIEGSVASNDITKPGDSI